jgi:hypothetical protein
MAIRISAAPEKVQSSEIRGHFTRNHPLVEEKIRERAHEIWLQRAGGAGSDVLDWLQAEEESLSEIED